MDVIDVITELSIVLLAACGLTAVIGAGIVVWRGDTANRARTYATRIRRPDPEGTEVHRHNLDAWSEEARRARHQRRSQKSRRHRRDRGP